VSGLAFYVDAFADALNAESAIALFPSGIFAARQFSSLFLSFFFPPLKVTLSLTLAESDDRRKEISKQKSEVDVQNEEACILTGPWSADP